MIQINSIFFGINFNSLRDNNIILINTYHVKLTEKILNVIQKKELKKRFGLID